MRCVEKTGSSAACGGKVDDFLACERRVFMLVARAARERQVADSSAWDASSPIRQVQVARAPPPPPLDAEGPLESVVALTRRAVEKERVACGKIVEMVLQDGMAIKMVQKALDVFVEGGVVVGVVWGGVGRKVREWWEREER